MRCLLILARADAGQAGLKHEEVDLGELTLDVVERLGPLARRSHPSESGMYGVTLGGSGPNADRQAESGRPVGIAPR